MADSCVLLKVLVVGDHSWSFKCMICAWYWFAFQFLELVLRGFRLTLMPAVFKLIFSLSTSVSVTISSEMVHSCHGQKIV